MTHLIAKLLIVICSALFYSHVLADQVTGITPIVIEDFSTVGITSSDTAKRAKLLIAAKLSESNRVNILDRETLDSVMEERTLSLSSQPAQVGQETSHGVKGAKYLLGGTVLESGFTLHIFCKFVSVADGSMQAFTISGSEGESISGFATKVSNRVQDILTELSLKTQPTVETDLTRVAALNKKLSTFEKPSISVSIKEEHIRRTVIDPAAETEFMVFGSESGFPVIDKDPQFSEFVDILVTGEGFTEVSFRQGAAFGVTARLEVKAIDKRTGRIVSVDRQTSVALSSSELIGSKNALAKAAAAVAERMLPKMVTR